MTSIYLARSNDNYMQQEYGERIWSYIPHEINKVSEICLPNIAIDHLSPIIVNCTTKINKWWVKMESKHSPLIANICNELLIPNVLCPWDCTEYFYT